jgi:hypothetical protein
MLVVDEFVFPYQCAKCSLNHSCFGVLLAPSVSPKSGSAVSERSDEELDYTWKSPRRRIETAPSG